MVSYEDKPRFLRELDNAAKLDVAMRDFYNIRRPQFVGGISISSASFSTPEVSSSVASSESRAKAVADLTRIPANGVSYQSYNFPDAPTVNDKKTIDLDKGKGKEKQLQVNDDGETVVVAPGLLSTQQYVVNNRTYEYKVGATPEQVYELNKNVCPIRQNQTNDIVDPYCLYYDKKNNNFEFQLSPRTKYFIQISPSTGALSLVDPNRAHMRAYPQTFGLMLLLSQTGESGIGVLKKFRSVITDKDIVAFADIFDAIPAIDLASKPNKATIFTSHISWVDNIIQKTPAIKQELADSNKKFLPYSTSDRKIVARDSSSSYYKMVHTKVGAGIVARSNNRRSSDTNRNKLERAKLLYASYQAGNTSERVKKELKQLLKELSQ